MTLGGESLIPPQFEVFIKVNWRIEVNQNVKAKFLKGTFLSWFWTWSKWFGMPISPISWLSYFILGSVHQKKIVTHLSKYTMSLNFNFPLISFLLMIMVTSQNPVSSTTGGLKWHHVAFRNCSAFVRLTNIKKNQVKNQGYVKNR